MLPMRPVNKKAKTTRNATSMPSAWRTSAQPGPVPAFAVEARRSNRSEPSGILPSWVKKSLCSLHRGSPFVLKKQYWTNQPSPCTRRCLFRLMFLIIRGLAMPNVKKFHHLFLAIDILLAEAVRTSVVYNLESRVFESGLIQNL